MKKILAFTIALAMALSLAACGGKDDPKPSSSSDPGTSQQTQQPSTAAPEVPVDPEPEIEPEQPDGGEAPRHELFDLTEGQFRASEELTFDSLPVYMTKAIGTLTSAYIDQYSESAGIDLSNVTLEDMEILLDYYRSCGGEVVNSPEENQEHKYEFSFDGTSEMSLRIVYYSDGTIGISCFYLK